MKVWIRVGVSAGILALLFYFIPWSDLRSAIGRISGAVWFTVLAGFLAGHTLGALKWRALVNAGRSTLSMVDAVRCYAAGLFANMCLPSIVGGDVLRAVLAGKATGRAEAAVLGGLTDRLVDMAVVALLVAIGGFFSRDALPGWGVQLMTAAVVIGLITAMIFLPLLRGLVVRDATLAALLVPFGVPAALGFIASLLWQTILIAGGLVAGAVWWILGRRTTVSRSVPESLALRVSAS
jgi:glycosyltransferase 2 family protein